MLSRRGLLGLGLASLVAACSRGSAAKASGGVSEAYGTTARQVGEWWVPEGSAPFPLVVLVHGGYWRDTYDLHLEDDLARDLAGRGFLVWNVDYAPSSAPWPSTLLDAAAAYDHGVQDPRVDRTRVAVVGHSAGGHLALWLASRTSRTPGGAPAVRPALAVPQAPVASLVNASALGLGSGAVDALLGGAPAVVPERYAVADPVTLAPSGVRTVLVHGVDDDIVPLSQSSDYLAVARDCTLMKVPGGHFEHLDPGSEACNALRTALATL